MFSLAFRAFPGGVFIVQKSCSIGQQHQPPFQRRTPFQKNIQLVTSFGCKRRQSDTGVSARLFYNGTAGRQQTGFFRRIEHGKGSTVFHAAGGIEKFQLCQQVRSALLLTLKTIQLHQRRMPHQFLDGMYYSAHLPALPVFSA